MSAVIPMTDVIGALGEQGIRLRSASAGTHKTTCPNCSHQRRKQTEPCLSVTVDPEGRAVWNCHHCGLAGAVGGREYRGGEQRSRPSQLSAARAGREPATAGQDARMVLRTRHLGGDRHGGRHLPDQGVVPADQRRTRLHRVSLRVGRRPAEREIPIGRKALPAGEGPGAGAVQRRQHRARRGSDHLRGRDRRAQLHRGWLRARRLAAERRPVQGRKQATSGTSRWRRTRTRWRRSAGSTSPPTWTVPASCWRTNWRAGLARIAAGASGSRTGTISRRRTPTTRSCITAPMPSGSASRMPSRGRSTACTVSRTSPTT